MPQHLKVTKMTATQKSESVKSEVKKETAVKSGSVYVVAPKKSITSMKGILSSGNKVDDSMIAGGKDSFDQLIKSGIIVKK